MMAKRKGNANTLRRFWESPKSGIRWGTGGDFNRCVRRVGKYLRDPKGYCALRHKRATGMWPSQHAAKSRRRKR
jgi:hypothetical protein